MKRLERKYLIQSSEEMIYEALTNQTLVSQWSGVPAVMSNESGAVFSLWGGSIVGVNLKVTQNSLVQEWKEKSWKQYSRVSFVWKAFPEGMELLLVHINIPDQSFQSIQRGWDEHYMNPLITWLESNNL